MTVSHFHLTELKTDLSSHCGVGSSFTFVKVNPKLIYSGSYFLIILEAFSLYLPTTHSGSEVELDETRISNVFRSLYSHFFHV